jgi:RNA polymerase sigma factor (sigma-70 family)
MPSLWPSISNACFGVRRTLRPGYGGSSLTWRTTNNGRVGQAFGPEEAERRDEPTSRDDDLRSRLLALPERQRLTVFLRYYADLSYDEIAAALGVRPGTVAASLNAAHVTLRGRLEEEAHR